MTEYAAKIENGVVLQVIVGDPLWANNNLGGIWVGSYSKVGIGWTYTKTDGFRPPKPYPSWSWDGQSWNPPVPYPDGEQFYIWDEDARAWVEVTDGMVP